MRTFIALKTSQVILKVRCCTVLKILGVIRVRQKKEYSKFRKPEANIGLLTAQMEVFLKSYRISKLSFESIRVHLTADGKPHRFHFCL